MACGISAAEKIGLGLIPKTQEFKEYDLAGAASDFLTRWVNRSQSQHLVFV